MMHLSRYLRRQRSRTHISTSQIFGQLRKDLIGKDAHRGVSFTYAWLANQFGHFSLGFIPTLLAYEWFFKAHDTIDGALIAAESVALFWFVFETFNLFLGALFKPTKTKLKIESLKKVLNLNERYTFAPGYWNLIFDTITDLLFFWIGSLACAVVISDQPAMVMSFLMVLCLLVLYPSYYWYKTKMYQQRAKYPFQSRLSQYNNNLHEQERLKIIKFLQESEKPKHLLLFGSFNSGKTTLAVALANEKSIRHSPCTYISCMKFMELMQNEEDINHYSGWENSEVLLVDDINPGKGLHYPIVTPEMFKQTIDSSSFNIKATLKEKSVIWVMGSTLKESISAWQRLVVEYIEVPAHDCLVVDIDKQ